MRRILTTLAVVVGLVLTGGATAQAITGNFSPDSTHKFVGLLAVYDDDGEFLGRCSGSLLTDRLFLTAGHCVVDDAGDLVASARIWFEQDAGADYQPGPPEVPASSGYPYTGGVTAHTFFSYGYPGSGIPELRDVGLVVLDKSVTKVYPKVTSYASLASAGTLDRYVASHTGNTATVTLSGYGLTYTNGNPAKTISFRSRLTAQTWIVGLGSHNDGGYNVQLSSSPARDGGGTCFGDSGGPIFVGNTDVVSAVVSFGMSANVCGGTEWEYRTDQKAVLDWILAQAKKVGENKEVRIV